MTWTADTAPCHVYTYKEGLLSRVGHDLKLRVHQLSLTVAPDRVEAVFDPASVAVLCAMRDGREAPGALSARDRRQIDENLRTAVLHPDRHPEIRFRSDAVTRRDDTLEVTGTLSLHGATRELTCVATRRGDSWRVRVRLHQPDFGITPFTAMLGTLRIKPHVDVELDLPGDLSDALDP